MLCFDVTFIAVWFSLAVGGTAEGLPPVRMGDEPAGQRDGGGDMFFPTRVSQRQDLLGSRARRVAPRDRPIVLLLVLDGVSALRAAVPNVPVLQVRAVRELLGD